jgi:glutathione S-transferase
MKLYYTNTSPFVRKVLVAARELGIESRLETIFLRPSPLKADPELSKNNPLSKIPALVLDDRTVLYDSPVICEYLDQEKKLVPAKERWRILRVQALCDGILEAAILVFYEKMHRPKDIQWEPWMNGQAEKARQGLDELEREAARFGDEIDLAQICAGVTLGWLEFRSAIGDVRAGRPQLTRWYERFAQRPSMVSTAPSSQ